MNQGQLKKPGRQICPLCALDDPELVGWAVEAPGLWRYTCTNHAPPFEWATSGSGMFDDSASVGIAEELGVYDDLLAIFTEPGPFLEWGIVEHLYFLRNPATYADLVEKYSHTALGPTKYSASAFLGQAAGKLAREHHLALQTVTPTGYWSLHLGEISAFALAPGAAEGTIQTWAEYAHQLGFDADDWPALGYRNDEGPKPKVIVDEPWSDELGRKWLDDSSHSSGGDCGWNHEPVNRARATRIVVTELRGERDSRGCCDDCYPSFVRYVGKRQRGSGR